MGLGQNLFIVFFVYGLAFFGMGLAMAMEAGRPSALAEARVLRPLAGFGLIHGTHEWLESYLLQAGSLGASLPGWLPWLRLGLLIGSFSSLLVFAFQALRLVKRPLRRNHKIMLGILAGYLIFIPVSAVLTYQHGQVPWSNVVDALARYLLAVPASALAAMGLRARSLQTKPVSHSLSADLNLAALAFAFYTLTQLCVHPISMFPANLVNEESFLAAAGFPIQVVRTVMAVAITISLLRATQAADEIRQRELFSAQQERLAALEAQESLRRELLQHTVRAQEEERARIARELHDETAQTLSAFTLELAALQNSKLQKPDQKQIVERLQALSRDMAQGLYRLVHDLRPAQLDDLGLVPALRFLIEQECCPLGMRVDFAMEGIARRLNPLMETALFRVGQEALTNLARHAQVQEGRVEIVYAEKEVTLRVIDHGRGFDPAENFHPPHGWGLAGMKERVESVGGALRIDSAPGRGTTIEVRVPVNGKEST
jgi:signal transduction histidine kinase